MAEMESAAATHPGVHWRSPWTVLPIVGALVLLFTWGTKPSPLTTVVLGALIGGAVIAAVHHVETIAERVGEPYGAIVLAVAVTVIEVALVTVLMLSGDPAKVSTLPRDTVFAAVMITGNGILGVCLLIAAGRGGRLNVTGASLGLALVTLLTGVSLVLPRVTQAPGAAFTPRQLAFAGITSFVCYAIFLRGQTGRSRRFFLDPEGEPVAEHRPSSAAAWIAFGFMVIALVAIVGLAKTASSTIERGVASAGLPHSAVGVIIALIILLPEALTAFRAARHRQLQRAVNLCYGSALACLGLTIPAVAIASRWMTQPLTLGLTSLEIALMVLTVLAGLFTIAVPEPRELQGMIHLAIFGAFIFFALYP